MGIMGIFKSDSTEMIAGAPASSHSTELNFYDVKGR